MIIDISEEEIDEVLNRCIAASDMGVQAYPGATYEDGVRAAIDWLHGDGPNPFEEAEVP